MKFSRHAIARGRLRLGITFTQADADTIGVGIRNGAFFKHCDSHAGGTLFTVMLRGVQFRAVVDLASQIIITVKTVHMKTRARNEGLSKYMPRSRVERPTSRSFNRQRNYGIDD